MAVRQKRVSICAPFGVQVRVSGMQDREVGLIFVSVCLSSPAGREGSENSAEMESRSAEGVAAQAANGCCGVQCSVRKDRFSYRESAGTNPMGMRYR